MTTPTFEDSDVHLNGAALLDELRSALTRYVVFPSPDAAVAVTCYIAATYAQPAWEHATRLAILSPEKRCGKSRLLDVIEGTCHRPLITVNISPAALVRSIGGDPPTLLLDEADTVFGKKAADNHEDLRGILNAGHQRNRPYIRWDAAARQPEHCPTFAMAVLAGIGDLPDTIMDRSVIVRMRRRTANERTTPFRGRRDAPALHALRDRLTIWATSVEHLLAKPVDDMPVEDRAADTWEPLLAVADAAGGHWPALARAACVAMVTEAGEADAESSVSLRLLADVRQVFGEATNLYTSSLLERLHKLEDAPWSDFYGRPLTATELARKLAPYGVRPTDVREPGGTNRKGYQLAGLYDAWSRYLPRDTRDTGDIAGQPRRGGESDTATAATAATAATPLSSNVAPVAPVAAGVPTTCRGCGQRLLTEQSVARGMCLRCNPSEPVKSSNPQVTPPDGLDRLTGQGVRTSKASGHLSRLFDDLTPSDDYPACEVCGLPLDPGETTMHRSCAEWS